MVKTYTAEERADRRRRASIVNAHGINRSLPQQKSNRNILSASRRGSDSSDASWMADLRAQGVDVAAFLNDEVEPDSSEFLYADDDETNGQNDYATHIQNNTIPDNDIDDDDDDDDDDCEQGNDSSNDSSEKCTTPSPLKNDSFVRQSFRGKKITLMRRLSTDSTDTNAAKKRFSSFLDQAYVIDENTGQALVTSAEEMLEIRRENVMKEDRRNFNDSRSSSELRERNKEWALLMAQRRAAKGGFSAPISAEIIGMGSDKKASVVYDKCVPPPTQDLPSLDAFNLDPIPTPPSDPRELGILPPRLPHSLEDIIPRRFRTEGEGISDGVLVEGSNYDERWASCDSRSMIVLCINSLEKCGAYLKCSREASLVRCPKCKTVAPVGHGLISERRPISRAENGSHVSFNSEASESIHHNGQVLRRKASLSSAVTTVGWGG